MQNTINTVGVIGLGAMGKGMAGKVYKLGDSAVIKIFPGIELPAKQ